MKLLEAYLRLGNEETQEYHVNTKTVSEDGLHAVYLDGFSQAKLDPLFGAGITVEIDEVESWMADYRHSEFWCRPAFGSDFTDMPDETQGLIYKKNDGTFGAVLPVVSEKYKCVLCGKDKNRFTARLFSWYGNLNHCHALAFVQTEGKNPYSLMESCAKYALKLLNTGCRTRKERRYPEIFEYLGWCSWDALQIRVNEADLVKKCGEFKEKEIPVKWAIIDDMWAEVHDFYDFSYSSRQEMFQLMHSSKLYSFRADPKRFPNGLEHCIQEMNQYGVKVGMWHPTTGYWMGIDPDGDIFREYQDCLIQAEDGKYLVDFRHEKAYRFYSAFHDYLRKCGAEFVKIDNQSMTRRFYKDLAPVGEVARSFHDAMEASVGRHFDNTMINCMGMASEDMFNRSVSPVSRCSDDFQPENSDWFTKHILQCSYNDVIQGQFYYCDWDMWWTDDAQATKNSILRAISGGPIYISDELDRSKKEILDPLVLSDGRILRCDRPAMPTVDCLTVDPVQSTNLFKLQNICGNSGILAVFHIHEGNQSVSGFISPSEVDGLEGQEFAVYEHFSKEMKILKYEEKMNLSLKDKNEFKLYIIVPIHHGFAAIGRTDKFISPKTVACVMDEKIKLVEGGDYAYVKDGKLFFASEKNQ